MVNTKFILFTLLLTYISESVHSHCSTKNLKHRKNLAPLKCETADETSGHRTNVIASCTKEFVETGTIIRYKCDETHISLDMEYSKNVLMCTDNGLWKNIERFNNYDCNIPCGVVKCTEWPKDCSLFDGTSGVFCPSRGGFNGKETLARDWPWHVAIFRYINSTLPWESPSYICGGTLIRSGIVVTAAHCISDFKRKIPLPVNEFRVILQPISGHYKDNFRKRYTMEGIRVHYLEPDEVRLHSVTEIHIPSTYDYFNFQSDVAILRLDSGTNFEGCARPICLPYDLDQDDLLENGQHGSVPGFGVDETGEITSSLKYFELPIASSKNCSEHLGKVHSHTQFCAGSNLPGSQSVCNGDSGGGFIAGKRDKNATATLHGIVSFNYKGCSDMAVFTKVSSFLHWIERTSNNIKTFNTVTQNISNSSDIMDKQRIKFSLVGTLDKPKQLNVIALASRSHLQEVYLEHVQLDLQTLVESLNGCGNLEQISMLAVNVSDAYWNNHIGPVSLPKLNSYKLHMLSLNTLTGVAEHFNYTKLLFFYNAVNSTAIEIDIRFVDREDLPSVLLETKEVYDSNLNASLKVNILNIRHSPAAEEVLIAASKRKYLKNCHHLKIYDSKFNAKEALVYISGILYIKLHRVRLVNTTQGQFKEFLNEIRAHELELILYPKNTVIYVTSIGSTSLRKFTAFSAVIAADMQSKKTFDNLKKMVLVDCVVKQELLSVTEFWDSLEVVLIHLKSFQMQTKIEAYTNYRVLHKLLNTPTTYEVYITNFQRIRICKGMQMDLVNIIREVETELDRVGFHKNATYFYLKKFRPTEFWQVASNEIYRLEGTQNNMLKFTTTGLPLEKRLKIIELHLNNVEVEPKVLLDALRGCVNLRYINITGVRWLGKPESANQLKKVYLPSLSDLICKPYENYKEYFSTFSTCMFFFKEPGGQNLDPNHVLKYGINFDIGTLPIPHDIITSEYYTAYKFNYNTNEYISRYQEALQFPYNTPETMRSFHPVLVELYRGKLDVKKFANSTFALKRLKLIEVDLIGGDLNKILPVSQHLEALSFERFWEINIFDIAAIANPKKLKVLSITGSIIDQTSDRSIALSNLTKGIFVSVEIKEKIFATFNSTFPSLKSLRIQTLTLSHSAWIPCIRLFNQLITSPENYKELINLEFLNRYMYHVKENDEFGKQQLDLYKQILKDYGITDRFKKELKFFKEVGTNKWTYTGNKAKL